MSARAARWAAPSIAVLALLASIAGIVNGFTYDDVYVIEKNPAMQTLAAWWRGFASSYWPRGLGGDGYRPFTILIFKIQYAVGGGKPMLFHAASILLYALAAVLAYRLARRTPLGDAPDWAPWLVGALFAVHPVHVEAVANVVGQSELIVAVAVVGATILYLRDRRDGPLRGATIAVIALLYAVAGFSKEHGIVLPAILVAAELTVIRDATAWRERVRRERPFYLFLALIAVCFLAARSLVLSDHPLGGFSPFMPFSALQISSRDRVLTALGVVPEWVRLLYWPARLSSEYGPPMIEIAQGPSVSQLPGLLLLIGVVALAFVVRRQRPVTSFGIAFAAIALAPSSNFLLPAGIVLAERTLFLPSVGAMLVAGDVVVAASQWLRGRYGARREIMWAARTLAVAVLVAGAARSAVRSTVWHDNDRLFRQAVIDSPDSYRAHFMLGRWLFTYRQREEGEAELHRALSLFPYDPYLSYDMAERYRSVGLCAPAIPLYKWSLGLSRDFPYGRGALARCLLEEGHYEEARTWAFEAIRVGAPVALMRPVIAVTDSVRAAGLRGGVEQAGGSGKVPETVQKAASATAFRPNR